MTSTRVQGAGASIFADVHSDVLYRNPSPHLKSIHAYFPSVVVLPDGQMVATYVLGEAFESVDMQVHLARSDDGGQTWRGEGTICPATTDRVTSTFGRIAVTPEGELVANVIRYDRTDHANQGLTNPENIGHVPTELLITRSSDAGNTWTPPHLVEPPLSGPEFEMCAPVTILRDGRWLWPTSTWRDWQGNLPNGNRMVALVSDNEGHTWPSYLDVMHSPDNNLIFWESKIVELNDGRLLAVAWCYDERARRDRPNQYAVSDDGGATWSEPLSTGLLGQTMTPFVLDSGRILCAYRRMDKPGLWAAIARLDGDRWVTDALEPLWGHTHDGGITTTCENMVENFNTLKFGAPSMVRCPDGSVFLAFWCYEDNVSVIRGIRLQLDEIDTGTARGRP